MTNLEVALAYLKRGWPVIPGHNPEGAICSCTKIDCDKAGKHPRVQWQHYQKELPGDGQVRTWWRRWPNASVIVVTGELSGLLVMDIDPRSGGDESLLGLNPIPPTVTTITGGGGQHFWFQYPKGSGITIGSGLLPGIDWRGEGGYVVAPPSLHMSGRPYEWEPGFGPDEHPFATLPTDIMALLQGPKSSSKATPFASQSDGMDIMPYITGEARLPAGQRNHMLAAIAGHLLGTGSTPEAALGTLWLIAQQAETGPGFEPLTLREVQQTLASIHRAETRKREAATALHDASVLARIETLGGDDVTELARAAWRELGVPNVIDWVKLTSAEGIDYQLELPDRVVSLGGVLLGGREKIRDVILNATGVVMPRMKAESWEPLAGTLARLAREEYTGAMRQSDEVAEWLEEYMKDAVLCDVEQRDAALRTGPICYNDGLAVRTRRLQAWLEGNFSVKLEVGELARRLTISGWKYQPIRAGERLVKVWVSPPLI